MTMRADSSDAEAFFCRTTSCSTYSPGKMRTVCPGSTASMAD
jgi:hypothetical protein